MAIVAEGRNGKLYISPTDEHERIAEKAGIPENAPHEKCRGTFASNAQGLSYGILEFKDYFTKRQLNTLDVLCSLVDDVREKFINDSGESEYANAIVVFLSFIIDRVADFSTSVSRWSVTNEKAMNMFSKQAIPMTWDYPEVNILADSVGGISTITEYISKCIMQLAPARQGFAFQNDAQNDFGMRGVVVSTDPPYYNNVTYADLSDFFYVWLRRNLKPIYPELFKTMLVPKSEELIAEKYRFKGNMDQAKAFFETGMSNVFNKIHEYANDDVPVTVYYAYKQSEDDESKNTSSSGWETMLSAIINAHFTITGTWPLRTEQAYRAVSMNTNALASSIVLSVIIHMYIHAETQIRNFKYLTVRFTDAQTVFVSVYYLGLVP
ncbi:MAG: DUF1156 domain-containing protein, partial [Erysipelotrichaceae bacterium]|nr:DUF1156 domain-containing protein [Erysipelotrichaceae bacterium]